MRVHMCHARGPLSVQGSVQVLEWAVLVDMSRADPGHYDASNKSSAPALPRSTRSARALCTCAGSPGPHLADYVATLCAGSRSTWGLSLEVIQDLQERPPPELVAVQSRLQALYPEYVIAHMPTDSLQPESEEGKCLTPFVGNAVLRDDACVYHIDMCPGSVPPGAAWLEQYGWCAPHASAPCKLARWTALLTAQEVQTCRHWTLQGCAVYTPSISRLLKASPVAMLSQ